MKTNYIRRTIFLVSSSAILLLIPAIAMAERNVTVATIGNVPPSFQSENKQEMVNHVITFWEKELKQVYPDKPDLIVLPEFCDFSGEGEEYLKVRKNQVLDYLSSAAKANHCYIAFGTKREDKDGLWRNSCVIIDRNGEIAGIYNKNFPTIGEMESGIKACNDAPVIQCDFGRVAVVICYDLNFDELRLRYAREKPDLIIFSSMYHGGIAQNMWAYTCRAHFVGSVYRQTPSQIRNPMGEVVASSTNYFDFAVARINLDCALVHLDYNWEKLTALKEKYGTSVSISDPGELASVLVTSNDSKTTVDQMLRESGIERLDDYLNRARHFRQSKDHLK
ncbi:MAG: carbon-nitrogen hydrolase family protein [Bacteroidales bacterium]|nr:carbon-nitrogen hydrolase family protein [Bacteroidales bacterium]